MAHVIEPATTGRATCRGCGGGIAKGAFRFGERLPNPFAKGEMTHWSVSFQRRALAVSRSSSGKK